MSFARPPWTFIRLMRCATLPVQSFESWHRGGAAGGIRGFEACERATHTTHTTVGEGGSAGWQRDGVASEFNLRCGCWAALPT